MMNTNQAEQKNSQGIKKGDILWVLFEGKWVKAIVISLNENHQLKDSLRVKNLAKQGCAEVEHVVEVHQYQLPEIWHA